MNDPAISPVIIIGAGRSGTKMIRDALCRLPGLSTWGCDEIPFIWRRGNVWAPHDELLPTQARSAVRRYVRRAFRTIARRTGAQVVVEKTCANSLRVAFVARIFPKARFLWLIRDGRDVVSSAMKRWTAPLDISYTLKKARYVPLQDLPFYGARFAVNRISQLMSVDQRLPAWGPRFAGMEELVKQRSLAEVCAAQWARCMDRSAEDFLQIDKCRVVRVRYEDFVANPTDQLGRIVEQLRLPGSDTEVARAVTRVRTGSVGKGKKSLDSSSLRSISPLIDSVLRSHGYET